MNVYLIRSFGSVESIWETNKYEMRWMVEQQCFDIRSSATHSGLMLIYGGGIGSKIYRPQMVALLNWNLAASYGYWMRIYLTFLKQLGIREMDNNFL